MNLFPQNHQRLRKTNAIFNSFMLKMEPSAIMIMPNWLISSDSLVNLEPVCNIRWLLGAVGMGDAGEVLEG